MKKKNLKVGLAHGVFDIVHIGHLEHFRIAKQNCDKLIVSVTADKYVNKGPNRPAFKIKDRVNFLQSIKYIDEVIISNHHTALNNIKRIKPNIYFKGLDYNKVNLRSKNDLSKEINILKKYGGKFFVTKSKLNSSSKILNDNFNFLKKDLKSFLKTINKKEILKKLNNCLFSNKKKFKGTILLTGEQILDFYTMVNLQGKSQKSGVISSVKVKTEKYGGGSILVASLFKNFFKKFSYLIDGSQFKANITKKYIGKSNNINFILTKTIINKILIKERYIDNYSKSRLFQVNQNQKFFDIKNENLKFQKILNSKCREFNNIVIFDFGYGYFDEKFADSLKNKKNNFFINCQTNSSNYGFNLFSKFKKAEIMCVDEAEFRLTVRDKQKPIYDLLKENYKLLKRYKVFIITSGSSGCHILHKNKIFYIPTVFETTADTTGCGDIFFSTFIYLYTLKIFSLKEIALLSHTAAGLHGLNPGNKNIINKDKLFKSVQSILK